MLCTCEVMGTPSETRRTTPVWRVGAEMQWSVPWGAPGGLWGAEWDGVTPGSSEYSERERRRRRVESSHVRT
jgi:hypothetical protein